MKHAPLLVLAGTVAGFLGVLGFHLRQAPAAPRVAASPATAGPSVAGPSVAGPSVAGPSVAGGVRSAVGPQEQFGYGVLDVKVTARGSRITDVSVPLLQTAEPTSQQISEQAIAMLRSEVLSAQGLNINAISGATYTSEAYGQSLQAALDRLHIK
jgi:uncharacterized protein with FMN-binding domain